MNNIIVSVSVIVSFYTFSDKVKDSFAFYQMFLFFFVFHHDFIRFRHSFTLGYFLLYLHCGTTLRALWSVSAHTAVQMTAHCGVVFH